MPDWSDRLDRFVESLRRNRRPESGLARTREELEDLRMAGKLAGLRDEFAEPDPRFLAKLRNRVGAPAGRPTWRLTRARALRVAAIWVAGVIGGVGLDRLTPRAPAPATSTAQPVLTGRQWYPVGQLANLTDGVATPVDAGSIPAFVIREGESVRAVSRVCTHMGCLLIFSASKAGLQCPCHGAVFDVRGRPDPLYVKRPLPPLPVVQARVVDGTVYVLGA